MHLMYIRNSGENQNNHCTLTNLFRSHNYFYHCANKVPGRIEYFLYVYSLVDRSPKDFTVIYLIRNAVNVSLNTSLGKSWKITGQTGSFRILITRTVWGKNGREQCLSLMQCLEVKSLQTIIAEQLTYIHYQAVMHKLLAFYCNFMKFTPAVLCVTTNQGLHGHL